MVALPQRDFIQRPFSAPLLVPAPAAPAIEPRRVAVVVNGKARAAGAKAMAWLRAEVPTSDLYVSHAIEDLPAICEMILARRYHAVVWAGGDGTFVRGAAALVATAQSRRQSLPELGILRMGTGNAVAETFAASPCSRAGIALDLARARQPGHQRRSLSLLSVEGEPTVFCGLGIDAMIQDDYLQVARTLRRLGLGRRLGSASVRYLMSVAGRTVPRFVLTSRPELVAINRGAPAIRIDATGHQIAPAIPAGRVLWRGPLSLMGASTVPYYGLGLKMFASAQRRVDRFQLRLSDISAPEALANLPEVWRGTFQSPHIHDFLCDEVELVLSRPSPFQVSGDIMGDRGHVTVSLSPTRLTMI
jgi:diacylglycerol kinase family enzyme